METLVVKFDATMLKAQIDELVRNTELYAKQQRVDIVSEVLRILDTNADMDIMRAQIQDLVPEPPKWHVMFVQPSMLDEFKFSGANLLTVSRNYQFPFVKKVMVRA